MDPGKPGCGDGSGPCPEVGLIDIGPVIVSINPGIFPGHFESLRAGRMRFSRSTGGNRLILSDDVQAFMAVLF